MEASRNSPLVGWQPCALNLLTRLANPAATVAALLLTEEVRARLVQAKIDGLERLAGCTSTPLQRVYDRVWQVQLAATEEAISRLGGHGIDPLLFKGVEIAARYLHGHMPSMMGDVDMLVPRQQLGAARAALFSLGYRQAEYDQDRGALVDADVSDIARVEGSHYELFPFRRMQAFELDADELAALRAAPRRAPVFLTDARQACLIVELDIHHGVALDIETAPLLARSQQSVQDGARTLSHADHLWVTTARYYNETAVHGKRTLRDFTYVIALLRDAVMDWDIVLDAAHQYELHPGLFYYLSFASSLFSNSPVPADVLADLDPRRGSRLRDWGWQLGPLFDALDPMPSYRV